ncbi:MAG: hypothetical protein SGJ07_11605 [Rhodospirillaceae bacterium]|nr:hypothetical protein [Rhodospirillaceae bacterium]
MNARTRATALASSSFGKRISMAACRCFPAPDLTGEAAEAKSRAFSNPAPARTLAANPAMKRRS